MSDKPLYLFDPLATTGNGDQEKQECAAMTAGCEFVRLVNAVIAQAQKNIGGADQEAVYAEMGQIIASARQELNKQLMMQTLLASDLQDAHSPLAQFAAASKRLEETSENMGDEAKLIADSDAAGDEQRKSDFRGQLQQSLMDFASTTITADQSLSDMAKGWKIVPDPNHEARAMSIKWALNRHKAKKSAPAPAESSAPAAVAAGGDDLLGTMQGDTSNKDGDGAVILGDGNRIMTALSYAPPVKFTIVAQTDSTNIRLGYAADQIIFNWEYNQDQLRIDGGPANGRHTDGAGRIPTNQWVTVEMTVLPGSMTIAVDGQQRFSTQADFSQVNQRLSIFEGNKSQVKVKSVIVSTPSPGATPIDQPDVAAIALARAKLATADCRPLATVLCNSDQMLLGETDKPYEIKDVYQPGRRDGGVLTLDVEPGVEIHGGRIDLQPKKNNSVMVLNGSRQRPIILRNVEIDQPLGSGFTANYVIFDQCTFQKSGGWYAYFSSKWEMNHCLLYKCNFGTFNGVDYGFKLSDCTLVGMTLAEIHHDHDGDANFDYMDRLRKDWNILKVCSFVDCTVPPTVFWCSESSNFWGCTFVPGAAFKSAQATQVIAYVAGTAGKSPQEISQDNPPAKAALNIILSDQPFPVSLWGGNCPIPELRLDPRLASVVLGSAGNR